MIIIMEKINNLQLLSFEEMIDYNGGGFAYDVGCVLGFLIRSASGPAGQAQAYAVWYYQHS
jgi:hypothetical protein